jgi:hypothetical protein
VCAAVCHVMLQREVQSQMDSNLYIPDGEAGILRNLRVGNCMAVGSPINIHPSILANVRLENKSLVKNVRLEHIPPSMLQFEACKFCGAHYNQGGVLSLAMLGPAPVAAHRPAHRPASDLCRRVLPTPKACSFGTRPHQNNVEFFAPPRRRLQHWCSSRVNGALAMPKDGLPFVTMHLNPLASSCK